ncbi:hypothetical protein MRX96_009640 [Rhipicephalus microplus]
MSGTLQIGSCGLPFFCRAASKLSMSAWMRYCTDLERFGKSLLPLLTDSEIDFKSALTSSLEEWHYIAVLYMSRCVESFAENIAALNEASVKVTTENSRDKSDVEK